MAGGSSKVKELKVETEVAAKFDEVEKAKHYNQGKFEVIEVLKDWLTEEEYRGFLRGNVIKYEARYREKGGVKDLKKAEWYNCKLIELETVN